MWPRAKPGPAVVQYQHRTGKRHGEIKRHFRDAGPMGRGELYEYFKRIGMLPVFYRMFPEP
jgi:hypothetical protein